VKKTSLKDIAGRVGVSTALVSYVISGKAREARVGKEMEKRILQAAKALNYSPNLTARSLQSGRTNTIGLVVADISNPFFSQLARIIEDEAAARGYVVVFGSCDENAAKSAKLLEVFTNRQVDALIIAPAAGSEGQLKSLKKRGVPFVLIDRSFAELNTDRVEINNEEAAKQGTEYLIEKGCKKIAIIAYDTPLEHMKARVKGYTKAIKKVNQAPIMRSIGFENIAKEMDGAIAKFQKEKVDGIFFATNTLALEGLKKMSRLKKIPALVAFDQSDMFEVLDRPPVFIRQPLAEMGKKAVELAIRRIEKPKKKTEQVVLKATLIK